MMTWTTVIPVLFFSFQGLIGSESGNLQEVKRVLQHLELISIPASRSNLLIDPSLEQISVNFIVGTYIYREKEEIGFLAEITDKKVLLAEDLLNYLEIKARAYTIGVLDQELPERGWVIRVQLVARDGTLWRLLLTSSSRPSLKTLTKFPWEKAPVWSFALGGNINHPSLLNQLAWEPRIILKERTFLFEERFLSCAPWR